MVRKYQSWICIQASHLHPLLPSLLLVQSGPSSLQALGRVPGQLCQAIPKAEVPSTLTARGNPEVSDWVWEVSCSAP